MDNEDLEQTLATVHALLQAEAMHEAATIVRACPARAEQTGYDNWNGGTEFWDVYFSLPAAEFSRLGSGRNQIEDQIAEQLKRVFEHDGQNSYSAKIIPAKVTSDGWRDQSVFLPRQVRINIFDGMRLEDVRWSGELDDIEFLSRVYDLHALPSRDSRFKDAAGDIWQHCINNDDWERDWVYTDERFQLIDGPTEVFLRFLCAVVHPVVRPEQERAQALVSQFNDQLSQCGWALYEEEKIAGRSRFSYRRIAENGDRFVSRGRTVADVLDASWMAKEVQRIESAIDDDPALAIGTAKELIETCCKTILSRRNISFTKSEDCSGLMSPDTSIGG